MTIKIDHKISMSGERFTVAQFQEYMQKLKDLQASPDSVVRITVSKGDRPCDNDFITVSTDLAKMAFPTKAHPLEDS